MSNMIKYSLNQRTERLPIQCLKPDANLSKRPIRTKTCISRSQSELKEKARLFHGLKRGKTQATNLQIVLIFHVVRYKAKVRVFQLILERTKSKPMSDLG